MKAMIWQFVQLIEKILAATVIFPENAQCAELRHGPGDFESKVIKSVGLAFLISSKSHPFSQPGTDHMGGASPSPIEITE